VRFLWPACAVRADLDDTLYPGNTGIGPALKRNIDEFLQAKLGVSADKAAAMRVDLFRTHGSSLAGLIVRSFPLPDLNLVCSSATAHFIFLILTALWVPCLVSSISAGARL
jgi:hypothetical protein